MEHKLKLEIPVLLSDIEEECEECIDRLKERIMVHSGVEKVHIDRQNGQTLLCLHYEPNLVSLEQVRRLAEKAGVSVTKRYRHEILHIMSMDCTDCALSVEHVLSRMKGVINVSVNYAAEKMRIEYDSTLISHEDIVSRIEWMGYEVEEEEEEKGWIRENWELVLSLVCGFFLALGFFGERFFNMPSLLAMGVYIIAYLAGGYDATRHGFKAAIGGHFDIDFLMVVAALGAAIIGKWSEGALLLFLFSMGHALEHYAMDRARHAITALGEITPKTARARRDGSEMELPVEELQRGDIVIVRNGERIPIDGQVIGGRSAVNQSAITGESVPVEKKKGDMVFAGSVNGDSSLEIEVTKLAVDTTLARVIQMVEEAQTQKSPTQRFTERFERVFVPVILVSVVLAAVLPSLIGWLSWSDAFLRAMALLVAASPCALAIATPSAVLSGMAQAARNGVLIKGGVYLENLGKLHVMALDKTGTITRGNPEVTDIISFNDTDERELLRIASAVESRSSHPLAQAIVRKAQEQKLELPQAKELQSIPGHGVQAELSGQVVRIGNLKFFKEDEKSMRKEIASKVKKLESDGKTTMTVKMGERFLGIIALADRPREEVQSTVEQLKKLGVRILIMLTGDNERVAAAIAREVNLTEYRAELLPDEKVSAIRDLSDKYGRVAMVGDGINDAPAMAHSTVGIAMGAGGTDVALESADVALMADELSKLPFAVALSRKSRRIILQNLLISMGVIALLIPATLLGLAGIGIAIVFHEGSTLMVVANALRILRFNIY